MRHLYGDWSYRRDCHTPERRTKDEDGSSVENLVSWELSRCSRDHERRKKQIGCKVEASDPEVGCGTTGESKDDRTSSTPRASKVAGSLSLSLSQSKSPTPGDSRASTPASTPASDAVGDSKARSASGALGNGGERVDVFDLALSDDDNEHVGRACRKHVSSSSLTTAAAATRQSERGREGELRKPNHFRPDDGNVARDLSLATDEIGSSRPVFDGANSGARDGGEGAPLPLRPLRPATYYRSLSRAGDGSDTGEMDWRDRPCPESLQEALNAGSVRPSGERLRLPHHPSAIDYELCSSASGARIDRTFGSVETSVLGHLCRPPARLRWSFFLFLFASGCTLQEKRTPKG